MIGKSISFIFFSPKGKFKPFRITKKGIDTGVFEKIPIPINDGRNNNINLQINNNIQNAQNEGHQTIRINLQRRNDGRNNIIDVEQA